MRFDTKIKRMKCRSQMIREMIRQGYMYNNSAEDIVDKWIEGGSAAITSKIVGEALRIAKINFVYHKKNGTF